MHLPTNNKEYIKWCITHSSDMKQMLQYGPTNVAHSDFNWNEFDEWIVTNYEWLHHDHGVDIVIRNSYEISVRIENEQCFDVECDDKQFQNMWRLASNRSEWDESA